MLDGPPHPSDRDHRRARCGESSHASFGKRPTEKDPHHGHLAGGRLHSEGGRAEKDQPRLAPRRSADPTKTMRREFFTPKDRMFATMAGLQEALDAWVVE